MHTDKLLMASNILPMFCYINASVAVTTYHHFCLTCLSWICTTV